MTAINDNLHCVSCDCKSCAKFHVMIVRSGRLVPLKEWASLKRS